MAEDIRTGWGGKRPEQGRSKGSKNKSSERKSLNLNITLTEEQLAAIRENAKSEGMTISSYVLKKIFN